MEITTVLTNRFRLNQITIARSKFKFNSRSFTEQFKLERNILILLLILLYKLLNMRKQIIRNGKKTHGGFMLKILSKFMAFELAAHKIKFEKKVD